MIEPIWRRGRLRAVVAAFVAAPALFAVLWVSLSGSASTAQDGPPEMISREQWGARPPIVDRFVPHVPREIIVHHTGTRQQPGLSIAQKMQGLQRFSQQDRPWADVPYHFYIDMSGALAEGRDLRYAGDTNTGYDTRHRVQIVLEGNFDEEIPLAAQLATLQRLVEQVRARFDIPVSAISGHLDHAATACPGVNLYPYIAVLARGGSLTR